MSLYRVCVWKVASLLKRGYWSEANGSQVDNPFSYLPSIVVDDITTSVIQSTSPGALKVTDLYYLLTSGRLEHFKLDDILLSTEELVSILMSLSVACQKLQSLTFRNVNCSDPYSNNAKVFKVNKALECLLKISPQLESLESCITFDLSAIRNCEKLKFLKLNFVCQKPLYGFIEEEYGKFWPNHSLKCFEVFEDNRNPVSFVDMGVILKYCKELTHVNTDIAQTLEFLHNEELYEGSLSVQYKLQRCFLGTTLVAGGVASLNAVHIATLTCPDMKEVDVLVNNNEALYALSDFKNLNSLLIQWELPNGGDFQLGVQLMLESIGSSLKTLHIINFYNVDWAAIATTCHKLEFLKVEYHSELQSYQCPLVCLQYLKILHVELMDDEFGCSEKTLIMLLSHCTNLRALHINGTQSLSDHVLNQILAKNSLSKVREAMIFGCNLSEVGIRNLISHLTSLEFLRLSSRLIGFEDAADIIHEINPHVILVADEGF